MATTTPTFGWSVPTSTDYVKDGATAIETLGDSIDATMAKAALQTVSTTKTTAFTTTSTSFVDVTGLSATITPRSTASKVLVIAQLPVSCSSTSGEIEVQLLRGATIINGAGALYYTFMNQSFFTFQVPITFLDSPASAAATTYKIQVRSTSGANTANVSRNAGSGIVMPSSITLIEVAG
jgi:hypothetical protein